MKASKSAESPEGSRTRLVPSLARWITGSAVGAALMYLFDPRLGRRRRGIAKDRALHGAREAEEGVRRSVRDLRHRADGAKARLARVGRDEEVSDDVLEARVRSKLGRYCSHIAAVRTRVSDGVVTLEGPMLQDEHRRAVRAVSRVRGVLVVDDRLELHDEPDLPALQGGARRSGPRAEPRQERWSSGMRLASGAGGLGLFAWGATRAHPVGWLLSALGIGLAARSAVNQPAKKVLRRAGDEQGGEERSERTTPPPAATPSEPLKPSPGA